MYMYMHFVIQCSQGFYSDFNFDKENCLFVQADADLEHLFYPMKLGKEKYIVNKWYQLNRQTDIELVLARLVEAENIDSSESQIIDS